VLDGERLYWDVEDEGAARPRWSPAELMEAARALDAAGIPFDRQGVYMSSSVTRAADWREAAALLALWVADYGVNDGNAEGIPSSSPLVGSWRAVELFQYTSRAHLPGYDGDLDLSIDGGDVWTVYDVQRTLNAIRNAGLVEDGLAGPAFKTAVEDFQSAEGLVADGVAGKITLGRLAELSPEER
jgi:GH25 family lysozyme M1 (1,4-beta-N-acetylmuramidase)